MNKIHSFHNDKPIESSKEDKLDRIAFAHKLAKAVIENKSNSNLVIGLYGEWGTGKTSILNLVSEHLNRLKKKNKPIVINFNPWNFSDQDQLLHQFFNVLSISLRRKDKGKIISDITKKIDVYSKVFLPLKLIPGLGGTVDVAKDLMNQTNETLKSLKKNFEQDLFTIKKELTDLLSKLAHKIIVIIDDVDRLNNSEIKQIFQLIKSIADFPNTVYVLAFDKSVVVRAIEKVQEGDGNEYLEKIIQVPFEIPYPSQEKVYSCLYQELETLEVNRSKTWNNTYWGNVFHSGLKYYFKNLRDINRFINLFKFNYDILKYEVNHVDLIAITSLQIFENKIYNDIRENKSIYTGVFDMYSGSDKKSVEAHINSLVTNYNEIKQRQLKNLLRTLFPKFESFLGAMNTNYPAEWLEIWEKEDKICSPAKIDIFFSLTIDEDDISNSEVSRFLGLSYDPLKLKVELNSFHSNKKFLRFLQKLEMNAKDNIEIDKIEPLLFALTDVGDKYLERSQDWIFNTATFISSINYKLLIRIEFDRRFEIMKSIINHLDNSIYIAINILDLENDRHKNEKIEEKDYLFFDSQLKELLDLLTNKVLIFFKDEKLYNHIYLENIFYWLKKNCDIKYLMEINNNYLTNYSRIANFLNGFKRVMRSQSMNDYVYKHTYYYDLENIKNYVDYDFIVKKIQDFPHSDEFMKLDMDQISNIKLFLDCVDGKVKVPK